MEQNYNYCCSQIQLKGDNNEELIKVEDVYTYHNNTRNLLKKENMTFYTVKYNGKVYTKQKYREFRYHEKQKLKQKAKDEGKVYRRKKNRKPAVCKRDPELKFNSKWESGNLFAVFKQK